ncbi:MAG: transcriptional antiterminator, Rof [Candidatus Thiodiazotropha sp.]
MKQDYVAIPCAQHEAYQYAVMKGTMLQLIWHDEEGQACRVQALPIDVLTRDQAEFLVVKQQNGAIRSIRLDRIIAANRAAGGGDLLS